MRGAVGRSKSVAGSNPEGPPGANEKDGFWPTKWLAWVITPTRRPLRSYNDTPAKGGGGYSTCQGGSELISACRRIGSFVCSEPSGVSISTNTSKKLSAGKSTPGDCCLTSPLEARIELSRIITGPTGERPCNSRATISVSITHRPSPGLYGAPRTPRVGPATVAFSTGPPLIARSMTTVAAESNSSTPAWG